MGYGRVDARLYIRQVDGRHNSKYFSRRMVMIHFACASSRRGDKRAESRCAEL